MNPLPVVVHETEGDRLQALLKENKRLIEENKQHVEALSRIAAYHHGSRDYEYFWEWAPREASKALAGKDTP